MPRFLLVRGVPGQLVANPHVNPTTRRFLGKRPNGVFWDEGPIDPETGQPRWPAAVPVDEVVLDDPSIRKAARPNPGDLTTGANAALWCVAVQTMDVRREMASRASIQILNECIATSLDEARMKLQPPAKLAPTES